ncbi:MAG TPA: ABC transporter substrate-binding protein [Ilumatobacter sp.]|nr:ABC transporter substrate-binding protein [Ilumatobacter sp.]
MVALALVVAACGDDDDDDATTDTDAPTTTAAAEEEEEDTATTEAMEEEEGTATTEAMEEEEEEDEAPVEADGEPIKVAILADFTGAFAPLVTEIAAGQEVYWDNVNERGGIDGRPIELLIEDMAYDVAKMQEKYEIIREEADIISLSVGSPHTAAIASNLVEDDLLAVPLTWYSGWAFGELGQNVYESYTNYCIESMNGLEWLNVNRDVQTVAIAGFPGEYGGDGSAGAVLAAEALGLEVVYDGSGLVTPPTADNPDPDQSGVISEIVSSGADAVWTTINPATLGKIMGGAAAQGYTGLWSGNSPSYSFKMLGNPQLAPLLDQYYIQSTYIVTFGTDVPGMAQLVEEMTAGRPDLPVSDVYVLSYTEGKIAEAILQAASDAGDLSRAGILEAAKTVSVDFEGLAPNQTWEGDPNDFVVRESYIYDVDLASYIPTNLDDPTGKTGSVLLDGPYVSEIAANFDFTEPCYTG